MCTSNDTSRLREIGPLWRGLGPLVTTTWPEVLQVGQKKAHVGRTGQVRRPVLLVLIARGHCGGRSHHSTSSGRQHEPLLEQPAVTAAWAFIVTTRIQRRSSHLGKRPTRQDARSRKMGNCHERFWIGGQAGDSWSTITVNFFFLSCPSCQEIVPKHE